MAASASDRFIKAAVDWIGAVGGGGVADASVTTVPLVSGTSLPTDTAVQITIDRVDANGTVTQSKKEVITGVVSGSNIINCVRGVEGTAQAHSVGAVVEYMLTAAMWNSFVDAMLGGHNQDGTLRNINSAATYTPAGAGTTTIYPTTAKINTITMPATTQTIAVSGDVANQYFVVEIVNVTSQGALTWFTTIKWADGVTPTLCGVNGKIDTFGFKVVSAGNYLGYVMSQNQ